MRVFYLSFILIFFVSCSKESTSSNGCSIEFRKSCVDFDITGLNKSSCGGLVYLYSKNGLPDFNIEASYQSLRDEEFEFRFNFLLEANKKVIESEKVTAFKIGVQNELVAKPFKIIIVKNSVNQLLEATFTGELKDPVLGKTYEIKNGIIKYRY